MSATQQRDALAGRPVPNGDPATWIYLDELPAPPEADAEVERQCKRFGWGRFGRWWNRRFLRSVVRCVKYPYYFWGKAIVYKKTPRGPVITYVGEDGSDELFAYWKSLPLDDNVTRQSVTRGNYPAWIPPEGSPDEA